MAFTGDIQAHLWMWAQRKRTLTLKVRFCISLCQQLWSRFSCALQELFHRSPPPQTAFNYLPLLLNEVPLFQFHTASILTRIYTPSTWNQIPEIIRTRPDGQYQITVWVSAVRLTVSAWQSLDLGHTGDCIEKLGRLNAQLSISGWYFIITRDGALGHGREKWFSWQFSVHGHSGGFSIWVIFYCLLTQRTEMGAHSFFRF